jgi:hypothetical protein
MWRAEDSLSHLMESSFSLPNSNISSPQITLSLSLQCYILQSIKIINKNPRDIDTSLELCVGDDVNWKCRIPLFYTSPPFLLLISSHSLSYSSALPLVPSLFSPFFPLFLFSPESEGSRFSG